MAVVVQKMVNPEKSGFIISRDLSGSISIYSIWGIGEGMNIKDITPDKCVLSKNLSVTEKRVGQKNFYVARSSSGALKTVPSSEERRSSEVLNNYEIQRLGDLAEKIDSHFGVPQKIDFAIDESGIYIMQSEDIEIGEKTKEESEISKPARIDSHESRRVEKVDKVTKTKLKLLLDSPFMVEEGEATGLKKVGFFGLENIIRKTGKHPLYFLNSNYINEYENLIYEGVSLVARNFDEIMVRTSDFLSSEFSDLQGSKNLPEGNPLLGLHGIRFGLRYQSILEAELRALKRSSQNSNVGVLIPNIISVDELKKVRAILQKIEFENVKLGVIIETPAAVQLIKDFCEEKVNSIVINSSRLLEYLLAIDNKNADVSELFNEMNPAFLYQLEYMIRVAKRNNVETNFVGSSPWNDKIIQYLVRKGTDFVITSPYDAKLVSEKIRSFESDFISGTDSEPRKYEIGKVKEDYLKDEKSKED
jgi:phosphoenolpyruvate synthase/pyruvate phosphate dikinase